MKKILSLIIVMILSHGAISAESEKLIQEEIKPLEIKIISSHEPGSIHNKDYIIKPWEYISMASIFMCSTFLLHIHIDRMQRKKPGVHPLCAIGASVIRYLSIGILETTADARLYKEYGKYIPEVWKARKLSLSYAWGAAILYDLAFFSIYFFGGPELENKENYCSLPDHLRRGKPMPKILEEEDLYEKDSSSKISKETEYELEE